MNIEKKLEKIRLKRLRSKYNTPIYLEGHSMNRGFKIADIESLLEYGHSSIFSYKGIAAHFILDDFHSYYLKHFVDNVYIAKTDILIPPWCIFESIDHYGIYLSGLEKIMIVIPEGIQCYGESNEFAQIISEGVLEANE